MKKRLLYSALILLLGITIGLVTPIILDNTLSITGTSNPEEPLSDRDSADRYSDEEPSYPTLTGDVDLPVSTGNDTSDEDEDEDEDRVPSPSVLYEGSGSQSEGGENTEPDILPNNTQSPENTVLKITSAVPLGNDPFSFFLPGGDSSMPVWLSGDTLKGAVSYGGGCAEHDFTLLWDGSFLEIFPVQVGLTLVHDGNGDMCEALVYETLEFDLTPLKDMYKQAYKTNSGTVMLYVKGTESNNQSIEYTF